MPSIPNALESHVTVSRQCDEHPSSPMYYAVKVPDFSVRSYWESRFASESSFEWLQPSSSILPTIKSEIQGQIRNGMAILHLGSGSSDLSNHLRKLLSSTNRQYGSRSISGSPVLLNVDFAAAAIDIGRRREREEFGDDKSEGSMHWAVVDILEWASFKRVCDEYCGNGRFFTLIVEKSCTDAIACGTDIQLEPFSSDEDPDSPVSRERFSRPFSPEAVVAIHLAAVTQPGGAWIALSYSAERFDFLRDSKQPAAEMWSVELVQRIVVDGCVEAGHGTMIHRPEIVHFVYTIRRRPRWSSLRQHYTMG